MRSKVYIARASTGAHDRVISLVYAGCSDVGRDDCGDRSRVDAKTGKGSTFPLGRAGDDIVAPEHLHLVRCERRYGQKLQNRRLKPGDCQWDWHQRPLLADSCEHEFHQFSGGLHLRSAELVNSLGSGLAADRLGDGTSHVADKHRLKNSSSGPNMIDGRKIVAPGISANTSASPRAFDRA